MSLNEIISFSLEELYSDSESFRLYVDGYCKKNEIVKEVAFTHSMVINAAKYYMDD